MARTKQTARKSCGGSSGRARRDWVQPAVSTDTSALDAMLQDGDLQLVCEDGKLPAHSQVLAIASDVLAGAMETLGLAAADGTEGKAKRQRSDQEQKSKEFRVDGTVHAWKLALLHLYPKHTFEKPTVDELHVILPIAHKYGMASLMKAVSKQLDAELDESLQSYDAAYTLKWLQTAVDLQLDDVRATCIQALMGDIYEDFQGKFKEHKEALSRLPSTVLVKLLGAVMEVDDDDE